MNLDSVFDEILEMKYDWKRPFEDTTHYPLIYSVFECDSDNDGQVFRIEDIQEERFGEAIELMKRSYLLEDPMMRSKDVISDEKSVAEIVEYWKGILDQKISMVCLKEDTNEIVGLSLLSVISEPEFDFKPKGEAWSEIRKVTRFIKDIFFNPFEHYNVENILTSGGCHVDKNHVNYGIENELIKARSDVGKLFDVRVSTDVFSTVFWQNAATKNEHDEKFSVSFKKLPKLIVEGYFPGIKEENLKLFCKKFY